MASVCSEEETQGPGVVAGQPGDRVGEGEIDDGYFPFDTCGRDPNAFISSLLLEL